MMDNSHEGREAIVRLYPQSDNLHKDGSAEADAGCARTLYDRG